MEQNTKKIERRLKRDGWFLFRNGAGHDIYCHPTIPGSIVLPRHAKVSPGVARQIAQKAGWRE